MHTIFLVLCALTTGSFGIPDEVREGLYMRARRQTNLLPGVEGTSENGSVFSDATDSSKSDLDSQIGSGYLGTNGKVIEVDSELNEIFGGVQGLEKVEENEGGNVKAGIIDTLSMSDAGIRDGNIAKKDNELLVEYEEWTIKTSSEDHSAETNIGVLISVKVFIFHLWLYFWLCAGLITIITCCFAITLYGFYLKLVAQIKSLKKEKKEMQDTLKYTMNALEKEHTVIHMSDWDTDL